MSFLSTSLPQSSRQPQSPSHDDLVAHVALEFLVWQADAVPQAHLVIDLAVAREDGDALHLDAAAYDGGALDAPQVANLALPAQGEVQHTGVFQVLSGHADSNCSQRELGLDG